MYKNALQNGTKTVTSGKAPEKDDFLGSNSFSALLNVEGRRTVVQPQTAAKKTGNKKAKKKLSQTFSYEDWGKEVHVSSLIDNMINLLFKHSTPNSKYLDWLLNNWRDAEPLKEGERIKLSRSDYDSDLVNLSKVIKTFAVKFSNTNNYSNNGKYMAISGDMKVNMLNYCHTILAEMISPSSPLRNGRACSSTGKEFKCIQLFFTGKKHEIMGNIMMYPGHIFCYLIAIFLTFNPMSPSWYSAWCTSWINLSDKVSSVEDEVEEVANNDSFPPIQPVAQDSSENKSKQTDVAPVSSKNKTKQTDVEMIVIKNTEETYASNVKASSKVDQHEIHKSQHVFIDLPPKDKDNLIQKLMGEIDDLYERSYYLLDTVDSLAQKNEELKAKNSEIHSNNMDLVNSLERLEKRIGDIEFNM